MDPVVSVILPTKNRSRFLEPAIKSVLSQTFKEFELIIIDAASTDNTSQVVNGFNDSRIKYLRQEKDEGVCAARTLGISKSKGDFVAFLDDDDLWLPKKINTQLTVFRGASNAVGVVYCSSGYYIRMDEQVVKFHGASVSGNIFAQIVEKNIIGNCSGVMVRRECFSDVGLFDASLYAGEDWDMWIRLAKKYEFEPADGFQYMYRLHAHRASSRVNTYKRLNAVRIILKKFLPDIEALPQKNKLISTWYTHFGLIHFENGDTKNAKKAYIKAIKENPANIAAYFKLTICIFGLKFNDILSKILQCSRVICPR
ncbi:MAG: glycosyltransferase [Candidatus Bathyarchaeota archaeon]|nr:glycosyltransferase [Candidatus Bathyarchaeota archaeon]